MGGRPVLPTPLKVIKGTARKCRLNPNEPKPNKDVGAPPKHLTAPQKKVWKELVDQIPHGVLGDSDRVIVEITSVLLADFRLCKGHIPASQLGHLRGCLTSLGMTPSDRSKVSATGGKKKNPWDEL